MNVQTLFASKVFKISLFAIAGIIFLSLAFALGMFVGYQKARFSYRWGEQYHRNFGGPRGGFFRDFDNGRDYINAHGIFGAILKIDGSMLVVKDAQNTEKLVLISSETAIEKGKQNITLTDLKINDKVTIIGSPNAQGQVDAKLIRVFP